MGDKHIKKKNVLQWIFAIPLLLIVLTVAAFSGYKMFFAIKEYKESFDTRDEIIEEFTSARNPNSQIQIAQATTDPQSPSSHTNQTDIPVIIPIKNEDGQYINPETGEVLEDVWDEYAPIEVDFEGLKKINKDVVGWIYVPDTLINYPIVQTNNNYYYMDHNFKKEQARSGSIMMDYKNSPDFTDRNTILYGHLMDSKAMFGDFAHYQKDPEFLKNHLHGYLITPEHNYRLDFIVIAIVPAATDPYYQIFVNQSELAEYLRNVKHSDYLLHYNCEDPDSVQQIITMSTCNKTFSYARTIVVATLKEVG